MKHKKGISCEIGITSQEFGPEEITKVLKLNPDRKFTKGEKSISLPSGTIIERPHNLWAIESKAISSPDDISPHINSLRMIFEPVMNEMINLKDNPNFEVSVWVWIEDDDGVNSIELDEVQLEFISRISNRFHITCVR